MTDDQLRALSRWSIDIALRMYQPLPLSAHYAECDAQRGGKCTCERLRKTRLRPLRKTLEGEKC